MSKFTAALKEKAGAPINTAPKPVPKTAETGRSGQGKGQNILAGISPPRFPKQLRSLMVEEDTTVQDCWLKA